MRMHFNPERGEISMLFEPCKIDRYFAFLLKLVYYEERGKGTTTPDFETALLEQIEAVEDPVRMTFSPDYFEFVSAFLGTMYKELESTEKDSSVPNNLFIEMQKWLFGEVGWHPMSRVIH